MAPLISLVLLVAWIAGIVLAKGFLSTLVAVMFPLWGYYLVVEHIILKYLS